MCHIRAPPNKLFVKPAGNNSIVEMRVQGQTVFVTVWQVVVIIDDTAVAVDARRRTVNVTVIANANSVSGGGGGTLSLWMLFGLLGLGGAIRRGVS